MTANISGRRSRALRLGAALTMMLGTSTALVVTGGPADAASCVVSQGYTGYQWSAAKSLTTASGLCVEGIDKSTLVFQSDGNLVLYTASKKAIWSSGTYGRGQKFELYSNALATVNGCTGRAGQGCSNPPAVIWSSKGNTSGLHYTFDKFMIQVGMAGNRAGQPCWVIGAHIKGENPGWASGTVRGNTSGNCDGTVAADGGTGSGGPGTF